MASNILAQVVYGRLVSKELLSGCPMKSMTQGRLFIGVICLVSGGVSGRFSGTSGNTGNSGNKGSSLGEFKYDFINLLEGNLSVITPST